MIGCSSSKNYPSLPPFKIHPKKPFPSSIPPYKFPFYRATNHQTRNPKIKFSIKKSFSLSQKTEIVLPPSLNADIPDYWHLVGLQGKYTYSCMGQTRYEWIAVRPLQLKDEPTLKSDPFNKHFKHSQKVTLFLRKKKVR